MGSFSVVPVIREGKVVDTIASYVLRQELYEATGPNAINYTDPERMDLLGHRCYDLLVDEAGDVVCCSGMYHRDGWPDGFFRTSNRTFVVPNQRTSLYTFVNPKYIGPAQIAATPECKLAFISREHPKARFYFRRLQQRVPFYQDWIISEKMVKVFPSEHKSSYQYVIYKAYNPARSIDEMPSISADEWADLED